MPIGGFKSYYCTSNGKFFQWVDLSTIVAAYGNALKTLSELYFKDHDGEVRTWLKDPLLAQQADRFASSWEGAHKNRVRDEATVYQTIKSQLETAKLEEANEEAKAMARAATTGTVSTLNPSAPADVSQYTTSGWGPNVGLDFKRCPGSGFWDKSWTDRGAVAVLMVVCENGKPIVGHCALNSEGSPALALNTKKDRVKDPYKITVGTPASVCESKEKGERSTYELLIRK